MLRKLILVVFTMLVYITITGQIRANIDPESIVAVWLFDEGGGNVAADSSGNGHDGEVKGNLKWIGGKYNSALEFPGQAGSFVRVPHHEDFNLLTFTMTAWIKAVNTGQRQEIIMKRAEGGVNSQNLHLQIESGRVGPDVGFTADNQWATGLFAQKSIVDEEWHHIAASYDQERLRIYVDGVPDGEQFKSTIPDNNDASVTIGAVFDSGGSPLNGALDDVGIFSVALEDEDIVYIMENGLASVVKAHAVFPSDKVTALWGDIKSR